MIDFLRKKINLIFSKTKEGDNLCFLHFVPKTIYFKWENLYNGNIYI